MNRAERRRAEREKRRGEAAYSMKAGELRGIIREQYREDVMREREAARVDAAGDAMTLMLAMPIRVLYHSYGWTPEMLRGFVDRVLELYGEWEGGDVSTEELEKDLWEKAGVRLERTQREKEE